MHYVMSDIHGEIERYQQMLKAIKFSDDDMLYVVGDVIDRFPGGLDILRDVRSRQNVVMMLGNHEQMCLQAMGEVLVPGAKEMWTQNGGDITRDELLACMTFEEREDLLQWLSELPTELHVTVNGQRFYLVHGFPSDSVDGRVWTRPEAETPNPLDASVQIIVGHTPIYCFHPDPSAFVQQLRETDAHMSIAHWDGFTCIDCGCGKEIPERRLACLRLEDGKEFYT